MEEQQAVLDESQENVTTETQGTENQETATQETQVDSATTEENAESDGVQKRINKLTAEKYGEKRRADALAEENERLKSQSPQQEKATQSEGRPTLEQFDFDDSQYQSALIAYEVRKAREEDAAAAQKEKAALNQQKVDADYDASLVKYMTDQPEFVNDIQNLPLFNNDTLSMIKSQKNAPQLVHYLSKNLDDAYAIASLDPQNAGVQIGIVLSKLSATTKQAVQTSTAPDPITPVTTGGSVGEGNDSPFIAGAKFE